MDIPLLFLNDGIIHSGVYLSPPLVRVGVRLLLFHLFFLLLLLHLLLLFLLYILLNSISWAVTGIVLVKRCSSESIYSFAARHISSPTMPSPYLLRQPSAITPSPQYPATRPTPSPEPYRTITLPVKVAA